jgi:NADPH2:quinone reductase
MFVWQFHEFGDIHTNYLMEEIEVPVRVDDEVLIRLSYASLNPADRLLVEGSYPGAGDRPLVVGRDGSGVIAEADEGSRFKAGDEVMILRSTVGITRQGTLAEYVTAPESVVTFVPEGWGLDQAAASALVYLTAWKALVVQGHLKEGEVVLVTGATGGVGIAAVQLANALGAKVIAMTRDMAKVDALLKLGAAHVIDSGADDLSGELKEYCGGGADMVIENIGGESLQDHIGACNLNGRIMVIGMLGGPVSKVNFGQVLFKQVKIEGVHVGKFVPTQAQDSWRRIVDTLAVSGGRPLIAKAFGMGEVHEAFDHLREGHLGKVLVRVDSMNQE